MHGYFRWIEDRLDIERATRGQGDNRKWFRARKGRITASIAKRCCGKGNPAALVKTIITVGKPSYVPSHHIRYGLENKECAVEKFEQQMIVNGHQCIVT